METEEEDNSQPLEPSLELENDSKIITPPRTAIEMDTQRDLPNTDPQCETESVAELHEPQFDSGYTKSEQPPAPPPPLPVQAETTVVADNQDQGAVAGGGLSVAVLSELEVDGGDVGDESKSPPPLSPQPPLVEKGEGEVAGAEEESQGIEPPQPPQEAASKEDEVGEEDKDEATKDNDEDVNLGVEDHVGDDKIESEKEVVGDLAEKIEIETVNKEIESEMAVEAEVTDATKELTMADKVENMEEVGVAEEMEGANLDGVAEEMEGPNMDAMAEEMEGANMDGVAEKMEGASIDDVAEEAYAAEEVEEEKVETEVADLAEETEEEEQEEDAEHTEISDIVGETEAATEEMEEAVNKGREMADVAEGRDRQGDMHLSDMGEEMEMAEETEKVNEAEETEMAEETEEAEEEVRSAGGKRKRGKNAKTPTRVSSRKKLEEDVCFICFDGGELVLCDRRGCPKAYHPACVNRDEAFFRAKGRWNCGWHLCSNCEKNAHYMCYTCTFSLCKGCIKDAVILCVRGNKGFCETCMKTVMLIESNEQGNKEMGQVDFDDKSSWEYLFKDYWIGLKERLSLTSGELAQAKIPWKGSDHHAGKQESPDEVYDTLNDGGSGSDSSGNAEVTTSKRRRAKKRLQSRAKERNSTSTAIMNGAEGTSMDESVEWASKELLEFVMHMKNGDKSVCSQFDVQALLLEYIKRNKLRDPRRKSQIICDSRLENLFGKPRVGHFEMLKLLESHFLLKDDSQEDDLQGSVADTEANQLEADENSDVPVKASKDKRRKSRKKGDGKGLQSNLDDYAAIDIHNINLIYLRRSLVEDLIEDSETFCDKAVGSFVRIRISGSAQKQDLYRLVQVVGTSKAAEPYRVGKKMTDFLLEILNLNKTEVVSIDIISNQEFTEDECKRLRQSIKCGLINRLTVGDIQEKAVVLQAVRVKDSLESEITRLSHLRDRASDLGRRKELRECVEKLQLLKSPEERQRRLEEIPEIHADPHMDPSYESEEEGETDDKRQDNYLRPRGSGFSRRGRELISPRKGGFASNDSWGGTRNYSSLNRELSRNMSNKGFSNKGDDAGEMVNENLWSLGGERETQQLQSWEKTKPAPSAETQSAHSAVISESVPRVMPEISPAPPSTGVTQSGAKVNETDKIWHYRDPSGKIQGPFSMVQLRKWSNTGYFPPDLRIWRTTEKQDDSVLLSDALTGNFQKDSPSIDSSFLKTQLVNSPHLSSSFSGNAAESRKPQAEISNSTGQAAAAPLEVPKYSTDIWGFETNLPSPTPAQTATGGTKGKAYESKWSPTPSQPPSSLLGGNLFSGGNGELQRTTVVVPESVQLSHASTPSSSSSTTRLSGRIDGTNISHGMSPLPQLEAGNAPQMHSQSMVPGESPRVQVNSHMLPAPDSSGVSVNVAVGIKSLQNLVQPVTSNNLLVGTHGWGAGSISKPEMNASHTVPGSGSQAWGSAPAQNLEPNNSISMPLQSSAYGNWGDTTSVHNSASSFTTGNPTGVSTVPVTSGLMPSDPWRAPISGQSNIQSSALSNVPWAMGMSDSQSAAPRQGPENQNKGWGAIQGNPNMGWGGSLPGNSNQGWVPPGQGPPPGNANQGWVAPGQGQAPGNVNPGWAAPVQGQQPGNTFPSWVPSGQGPTPVNANSGWVAPGQGSTPGNANPSWSAPTGNMGTWGSEMNNSGDRFSSQKDRGSQGGDSGYSGSKPWNRQSSFGRGGESSRTPFKGHRVCKFHENGHCKKGASCDYLHT